MNMHPSYPEQQDGNYPPREELVPSRYALRVGEIDVLVVSDGVLPLPTATMSTNADPAARAAWFRDMFLGPDAFDWALNVLVVRSGEQTILVDAGLGGQFPVAFDHPDWHNGFEHDPEESVRVRVRLLREAAASGELLVATHLPFPSVGRVAVDGEAFRWVAAFWDY